MANTDKQLFACSSWKRINLELKIPEFMKNIYPDEKGKPFILTKSPGQLEFKNAYDKAEVLKYAGYYNPTWSWYRSDRVLEGEEFTSYYLVNEVDGNIELNSIGVDADSEYQAFCSK